jgi:hypothetical protein
MVNNPSTIQIGKSGSPLQISNLYQLYRSLPTWFSMVFHLLVFTPNPQKSGPQAEGQGAQTQQGNSEMMFFSRGRMVKSKY